MKTSIGSERSSAPTLLPTTRVLRLPAVMQITSLARSTIYALIARELFPRPIKLSPRAVGWLEADIAVWIAEQARKSRAESPIGRAHATDI